MKIIKSILFALIATCILPVTSFAYPHVNFGIIFKPTLLANNFSVIGGSNLGLNFSPRIYTGISVNAISFNSYSSDVIDSQIDKFPVLAMNYIALEFDYAILSPEKEYFPSLTISAGYGNMNFRPTIATVTVDNEVHSYNPEYKLEKKGFFIVEPQLNLNMYFKPFYRLIIGVGYRFIPGLDYKPKNLESEGKTVHLQGSDLNGLTATMTIKFGGF
ncbi:MAG: hypothetical protein M9949_13385 [Candidatus Kapabacteria bacterium]|nr:hypothetical protein [Candidatus Kapabacteria bacterium]